MLKIITTHIKSVISFQTFQCTHISFFKKNRLVYIQFCNFSTCQCIMQFFMPTFDILNIILGGFIFLYRSNLLQFVSTLLLPIYFQFFILISNLAMNSSPTANTLYILRYFLLTDYYKLNQISFSWFLLYLIKLLSTEI